MKITPELQAFFVGVESRARKHGVECVFRQASQLPYPNTSTLVDGYFVDTPRRTFAVAMGKPLEQWLPVYVHESSHMDQYLEGSAAWKERCISGTMIESLDVIHLWIDRKIELTAEQLADYVRRARNVEWDCERRSADKIAQFALPIDHRDYIRRANSYLYFYTATKELRFWPRSLSDVYIYCPAVFLPADKYEYVPLALMDRYRRLLNK